MGGKQTHSVIFVVLFLMMVLYHVGAEYLSSEYIHPRFIRQMMHSRDGNLMIRDDLRVHILSYGKEKF